MSRYEKTKNPQSDRSSEQSRSDQSGKYSSNQPEDHVRDKEKLSEDGDEQ